ncbi:glycoside hydrolase family 2 [bacterium]|nr:MAG: glycoside hydrolase family 2 [bacterium]
METNKKTLHDLTGATLVAAAVMFAGSSAQAATKFNREFAPQEGLVAPVEKPHRSEICLNGSWQFQPVALPAGFQRGVSPLPTLTEPTDGWDKTPIRIPSPWNVNSFPDDQMRGGDFRTYPSYPDSWKGVQMGWLRRTFTVPAAWKGQRLMLHFGAVAGNTQIVVNGKVVGGHDDIFMPFDVDVTDAVQFGAQNTLLVGVRKSSLLDIQGKFGRRLYQGGSFWGQHIAGIWQDVFLEAMPAVHVDDVFVKPQLDKDLLEAQITVRNDGNQPTTVNLAGDLRPWIPQNGKDVLSAPELKWSLGGSVLKTNSQSTTIPAHGTATITLSAKVGGKLKLWSTDSPNLYGLVTYVKGNGGKVADAKYTRFGWRQITFQNGKTMLNGKQIALKGDSWHFMGVPQMTRRYAWAWFKACKDANLNAARLHAQPYPAFYMDMADEMGFFILDESAIWASDGGPKLDDPRYWNNTADHIKALVLRDRNHPSVFGWSVSNEVMAVIKNVFHGPKEMQDELVKHFKVWYDVCRDNDPTRPWVSADGEDDGDGTLPTYVIHYGGASGFKHALETGKPWGVGEAGPAYYGTPREIAQQSGNPRSYLSFQDRMEGVAAISYKNLMEQHQFDASYSSVFNLAWYGLKPLDLGMDDTTRPPALTDGIFFPPFVEGKPGVQPERLGPYTTTLNPGYDPRLPLYATWPLFDAIRDAQANPPVEYKPAHSFVYNVGRAKSPSEGTIKGVRVLSSSGGKLASALADLGVPVAQTPNDASLLFIDGAQPPAPDAKATIQQTLDAGGTVFVWGADAATLTQLNALLPLPLELTTRSASSLVPTTRDALTAGLTPEALYFSERSPFTILPAGLGGQFIEKATPILSANNSDWRTWNGQGEPTKTAMVMRSEREAKPSGVALAQLTAGRGRIIVSNIPAVGQTSQAITLNRTVLANLGIALNEGAGQSNMLDAKGVVKRALVLGRYGAASVEEALAASPVAPNSGSSIALGVTVKDRAWAAVDANDAGVFNLRDLPGSNPQNASSLYYSFWLNSPKDLANLLLDPHLPTLDLLVGSAQAQVWVNGKSVPTKTEAEVVAATPLLLQQGWNHILVKVVRAPGAANRDGGPALQLRSSQPDYLTQLRGAQQIVPTPAETTAVVANTTIDTESAKAVAIAAAEKSGAIVVSSERDEKGTAKRFSVQGDWNYPGVWTTPSANNRAIWEASLPQAGQYRVEIWYGDDPNMDHANNALVRVQNAEGEKQTRINLQQKTRQWVDLGTFRFNQGAGAKVTLEGAQAGGNLLADIVRFTRVQ